MVIAWFMGFLDTNLFHSMRENLAHIHLACLSGSPIFPKGCVFCSLPFYQHLLHLQAHYATRSWQLPLCLDQTDYLQPQEKEDEERGPQWLFLSLHFVYLYGEVGKNGGVLLCVPCSGSLVLHF